jgi:hypothetical protein
MTTEPTKSLETVFGFSQADLIENRLGHLSEGQIRRIRGQANQMFMSIATVLVVIGFMGIFSVRNIDGAMGGLVLILGIPMFIAFFFTVNKAARATTGEALDKRTGQVYISRPPDKFEPPLPFETAQGVNTYFGAPRLGMYVLVISDMQFQLNAEEHAVITPAYYTIYFNPKMRKIVSLELVVASEDSAAHAHMLQPLMQSTVSSAPSATTASVYDNNEEVKG